MKMLLLFRAGGYFYGTTDATIARYATVAACAMALHSMAISVETSIMTKQNKSQDRI
jgi:hypothetical protein